MHITLVGLNYQTAPVAIRDRAAISAGELGDCLSLLRSHVPHGAILSTCNRTETYVTHHDGDSAETASLHFLKARLNTTESDLLKYVYIFRNEEAIEHLFRVASGLDSMIIGEYEVLGQVRTALEAAEKAGMMNPPLRRVFQAAIRTGRRVREETGISRNALSVSSVAVDLAARVVGDLRHCKLLVIGTGEAGRLVAKVARERGTSQIVIASRSSERASALATMLGAVPVSSDRLGDELAMANVVVTCAGAPHQILDVSDMQEVMKHRPDLPLAIVDIAAPRNVEPAVGQLKNVFLYNIDDLTEISNSNRKQRHEEIQEANEIIKHEMDRFVSWWRTLEVEPVVGALMSKAEEIRSAQLSKTLKKLRPLSDEERENLDSMTKSIVTKILMSPLKYIKENGNTNRAEVVREIFKLDGET